MRHFNVLTFCFLLASPQVHACRYIGFQETIFFEVIPHPQPDADLIAEVILTDVEEEPKAATATATVTVLNVIRTSDAKVQQGDKVALKYLFSSCGPKEKIGMRGTIIAKIVADNKGRLVLSPYLIDGEGHTSSPRIELPSMSK